MTRVMLDINVLIGLASPASIWHSDAQHALEQLLWQGHQPVICDQVLREFRTVATRPGQANGLGLRVSESRQTVDRFPEELQLISGIQSALSLWLDLVTTHQVKGKRSHDIYLIATMIAGNVTRLITFNPSDFPEIPGVLIERLIGTSSPSA